MDKFVSWAIFLAIVGAGYMYYSQNNKPQPGRARGRSINRTAGTTTGKGDTQWLESDTKKKAAPKPAKKKGPVKSVKKAAQDVAEKVEAITSGASTAGADGDDDLSPANSPTLAAEIASKMPSGKDVSDMLEPKAAAANVMRILPSTQPARPNKQQPKAEAAKETKKQRQNKKKAEEAKAAREEAEKERKVLAEKQRRAAREARGEPAKNGLKTAQTPASNAWASDRPAAEVVSAGVPQGQLLDTFEPEVTSTSTNGGIKTPESQDWTNGVSEEEQLRRAMEETAWETVPKGKKQRKGKGPETATESKETATPVEATPFKEVKAPVAEKKAENKIPESRYAPLQSVPDVKHPLDSEWGVI